MQSFISELMFTGIWHIKNLLTFQFAVVAANWPLGDLLVLIELKECFMQNILLVFWLIFNI